MEVYSTKDEYTVLTVKSNIVCKPLLDERALALLSALVLKVLDCPDGDVNDL